MLSLLLSLFLVAANAEIQSWSDFSGGLNTRTSSVLLPDNESPDLANVVLDENAAITRRKGYSKINAAAMGDGYDVNAIYQLEQSDGDKYCVAFSSTNGYYSIDGCQTFTTFTSTLTKNYDVNCDAYGDNLYCVNNQRNFYFNGVGAVDIPTAPSDLNYIRVWRNRCFGTGKDTNPSRLYWSNLGTCTTWSPTTDYVDIDAEDGDVTTGIGPDLFNFLPVYKKFSTYLIQFDNANTANRKVVNVSRTTGAKNHRGIVNYNNRQYFSSVGPYGGQPGIYSTDGIMIAEDSVKLRGSLDLLSNYYSNVGRKTLDTKSDWDAGTFDPMKMSADRDPGFMQSSYTAFNLTTSIDWSSGTLVNLSTTDVSGSLTLSSVTARDYFEDRDYTTGQVTWTITLGGWAISLDQFYGSGVGTGYYDNLANSDDISFSSGNWRFTWKYTNGTSSPEFCGPNDGSYPCMEFRFQKASNGDFYSVKIEAVSSAVQSIKIVKSVSSVLTTLTNVPTAFIRGSSYNFSIAKSTSGIINLLIDDVFKSSTTDTSITGKERLELRSYNFNFSAGIVSNYFSDIYVFHYLSTGTWTSPIYDTYISTPVGGEFISTATVNSTDYQANFFLRESSMSNDTAWSGWIASSDSLHTMMTQRYQQIKGELSTKISSVTPQIDALSIQAASTGTWTSDELFLSNTMTGFGTFQTNQTVTGSGASISYSMAVSRTAGGTASTGTFVVTPGSQINHSSGAYVVVIATFSVYSATETAKLDTITINWNEGTSAKSATMAVYKNRLHFCGQRGTATHNDICYVRDPSGAWVKWTGINARHLNVVSGSLVAGESNESALGAGYAYKLYDTDSDNGGAINAYWESKDHILGKIQNIKAVDRLYLIGSPDATILTATLKADTGGRTASYDLNFSTGMSFKIFNKVIDKSLNGNVFRMRFENNAASKPWSVLGYGLLYRDLGLMQP